MQDNLKFAVRSLLLAAVVVAGVVAQAEVVLPKVLSDNMVLQRDTQVALWGKAAPGEGVTVQFGGRQARTTAAPDGSWSIRLGPFAASSEPREIKITATNIITLHNILVGEVWLCSGQSNMEYAMGSNNEPVVQADPQPGQPSWSAPPDAMHRPASMAGDLAAANDPGLRLFKRLKALRDEDRQGGWRTTSPQNLSDFSAIAYYFGEKLRKELNMPVGLIETSWGGSRIEPWTPAAAYSPVPAFQAETATQPTEIDGVHPGNYYDSMVKPLVPYTIKGFLWYQGESNVMVPSGAQRYEQKMQALIDNWRSAWGNDRLPFYYVQIAPLYYSRRPEAPNHPADAFSELREQQTLAMQIPRTGMVVVSDLIANVNDIHPQNKVDVGDRLARWALAKDYGRKDVVYAGPIYRSMTVLDGKIVLSFDHAEGLKSKDGAPLTGFTIAGSDGRFVAADAEIIGQTVTVSNPDITAPTAVRFSWGEFDQPNLVNGAGLPATLFRTDGPALPGGI
jgi:sialate O-acetylesterase